MTQHRSTDRSETTKTGDCARPAGLLLAAGAGRRFGSPKALAHDPDGTSWLRRSVEVLAAGCAPVTVVLGAGAEQARELLAGRQVRVVENPAWDTGMGGSLRTGLADLADTDANAVVITLVDLPDVTAPVIARLLEGGGGATDLARAVYGGQPGHPVLIGREHWAGVDAVATADRGARDYFAAHPGRLVDCSDLATGNDVDTR